MLSIILTSFGFKGLNEDVTSCAFWVRIGTRQRGPCNTETTKFVVTLLQTQAGASPSSRASLVDRSVHIGGM
jgi:hypothetical protein